MGQHRAPSLTVAGEIFNPSSLGASTEPPLSQSQVRVFNPSSVWTSTEPPLSQSQLSRLPRDFFLLRFLLFVSLHLIFQALSADQSQVRVMGQHPAPSLTVAGYSLPRDFFLVQLCGKSVRSWCDGSSDLSFMGWTHWAIYRSSQCSTTGVTKRPWYVLSCLWDDAYKRTLAVNRKE